MNLIICMTPLQVLIAEKIIENNKKDKFYILLISYEKNAKYEYYANRLKEKCDKLKYINVSSNIDTVFYILKFKFLLSRSIKNIYISNIDNIIVQSIISSFYKEAGIYTFDDGSANIDENSFLYQKYNKSTKNKIVRKLLGINLDMEDIKKISKEHYSIFNSKFNIIDNIKVIKLFSDSDLILKDKISNEVNIFLGQPIFSLTSLTQKEIYNKNIEITQKSILKTKCQLYFPHPRENYNINNIEYIKTPLIFEDWLINELMKNPTTKFKIYSFFTTCLLNIEGLSRVQCIALKPEPCEREFLNCYKIIEDYNIKIKTI